MQLDLIYIGTDEGTVKKEGQNFGKFYYIHKFMYETEIFSVFEFADSNCVILNCLKELNLNYLDRCQGLFNVFVLNNDLKLKLVNLK